MLLGITCAVLAIACLIYSVSAYQQKGPLLSTMYFVANKKERQRMKTKVEYYFIATVFSGIAIIFGSIAIGILFNLHWIQKFIIGFSLVLAVYVIVGSIKSEIKKK